MISIDRQFEIRNKALQIHNNCNARLNGAISTDMILIHCDCEVSHIKRPLAGLPGATFYIENKDKYIIVTDNRSNYNREMHRFTICHEIGHIYCGHFKILSNSAVISKTHLFEREASIFADELLMPTIQIIKYNLDTPSKVRNYFEVSGWAATNKLKYIDNNAIYQRHHRMQNNFFFGLSFGKNI